MFRTMVHRQMSEHFAPNDQEERVISESPNVGMTPPSNAEHITLASVAVDDVVPIQDSKQVSE